MLLESFIYRTSIAVNHGSHFQVRFVWQLLDGQLYHPPLNVYKILQLLGVEMRPGYDTAPRQDSKGKGSAKEETKHVHCRKLNKRNFCLTSVYKSIYNIYHSPYVSNIYIYTYQYVCVCIYIYGLKPWYPRYPKSWLANGCLFPSHPMSVLYYYIMLL